jgi:hypothetical protein
MAGFFYLPNLLPLWKGKICIQNGNLLFVSIPPFNTSRPIYTNLLTIN